MPVADSAADVLGRDDPSLVKKRENPEGVLLFYGTLRTHARRWCSMAPFGNRMKVRAHTSSAPDAGTIGERRGGP